MTAWSWRVTGAARLSREAWLPDLPTVSGTFRGSSLLIYPEGQELGPGGNLPSCERLSSPGPPWALRSGLVAPVPAGLPSTTLLRSPCSFRSSVFIVNLV